MSVDYQNHLPKQYIKIGHYNFDKLFSYDQRHVRDYKPRSTSRCVHAKRYFPFAFVGRWPRKPIIDLECVQAIQQLGPFCLAFRHLALELALFIQHLC
jgi:hypothetical protein